MQDLLEARDIKKAYKMGEVMVPDLTKCEKSEDGPGSSAQTRIEERKNACLCSVNQFV
jgi:hypothetical protein